LRNALRPFAPLSIRQASIRGLRDAEQSRFSTDDAAYEVQPPLFLNGCFAKWQQRALWLL
jgi:hypothetical protein